MIHADYVDVTHYERGYIVAIGRKDRLRRYLNPTQESLLRLTDFMKSRSFISYLFTSSGPMMWWFREQEVN